MGRTRRPGIGRPRVGRPHVGIHTVGVTHHDRRTHRATPRIPPAYAPPVTTEANGSVRVPVDHRALAWHSRFTKGCLWNAELLDIFGPRSIAYVHLQSSIELPDLLRRSGIDQEEFDAFLRDVRAGWVSAAPMSSNIMSALLAVTWILAPVGICCIVGSAFSPPTHAKLADKLEGAIAARAAEWRSRYGINARLERNVRYQRMPMTADDVEGSESLQSSEWVGNVIVFSSARDA